MANFELKKSYNFNIKSEAAGIIGEKYKLAKIKGIITSEEAVKYTDIATMHETLKPLITTLPDSVNDLSYVLFETQDGDQKVLALEYIDVNTIVEVKSINLRAQILGVSTDDIAIIKSALSELGYANVTVTTFE